MATKQQGKKAEERTGREAVAVCTVPPGSSFSAGMATNAPSAGAVQGPKSAGQTSQLSSQAPASSPQAAAAPPKDLYPAEVVFEEAIAAGKSTAMAFGTAVLKEPMNVIKIMGEEFVKDELKSFVAGMDLANEIAALSPNSNVQNMVTFGTAPLANLVDIYAGLVVGDPQRVKDAVVDTVKETATDIVIGEVTDAAGIKTHDNRVSPKLLNSKMKISDAGMKVTANNLIIRFSQEMPQAVWDRQK